MPDATPPEEIALMRRICARDQSALAALYDQYAGIVYGITMRVLQNTTLAEEATQDTFMKIWKRAEDWDAERGKLVTWVLTIARYTAIDRLRKEQRQSPWTAIGLDDLLNALSSSGPVDSERFFDAQVLQRLIRQLPDDRIKVIELAFFRGMSHSEIAEFLQEPLGTVKSRIRQGLFDLKALWLQSQE
ncbi:MAG: sigma-70 family RNA polymerase sigma factor [Anaerolineae bacterium]|nr:sigma-70 family RNA polymerase sigma factor [Anaerolineae bacterium]